MPEVSLGSIVKTLRHRVSWPVALRLLSQSGLSAGRGWDATITKLEGAKGLQQQTADFYRIFRDHLVSGEKSLRLYEQAAIEKSTFVGWLMDERPRLADPRSRYLMSDDDIQKLPVSTPKLISVEPFDDGVAGIFSSIRVLEIKQELNPAEVRTPDGKDLTEFTEIVGIKIEKRQTFDVVWAPHSGNYLDVRIDNPPGTTVEAETGAHQALKTTIQKQLGNGFLQSPINLFPIIKSMYKDATEGSVVELGFATSTGSVKNEKMRRNNQCLRKELYHVAGSAALRGDIDLFRMSIRWPLRYGSEEDPDFFVSRPELSLNGNTRMLHSTNPVIFDAVIKDCTGLADFEFVRGRVEAHLSSLLRP